MAKLYETYQPAVQAYVRRLGRIPADAEDLTQEFFLRFIAKGQFLRARQERGKFRTFLLTSLKNFLVNEWERSAAKKRGGDQIHVSVEGEGHEDGGPSLEIPDHRTADRAFEQNWAMILLARVRARLAADHAGEGKSGRFNLLERFLPGEESELTYAEAALRLGVAESTVRSDVHRLKRRYRGLLRDEVAQTVGSAAEVDEELRHLISVVSRARG